MQLWTRTPGVQPAASGPPPQLHPGCEGVGWLQDWSSRKVKTSCWVLFLLRENSFFSVCVWVWTGGGWSTEPAGRGTRESSLWVLVCPALTCPRLIARNEDFFNCIKISGSVTLPQMLVYSAEAAPKRPFNRLMGRSSPLYPGFSTISGSRGC